MEKERKKRELMNMDKCSDPGGEGVGGAGREGIEGINCDGNNKIKN